MFIGIGISLSNPGASGAATPRIVLSASTIAEDASVNDVIGTLSVANATGPWTFSIDSDPSGQFGIDGDDLIVADTLAVGSYPVTISAADGTPVPSPREFTITVTEAVVDGVSEGSDLELYVPFSGPNDATSAIDYSPNAHALTFNGNAKITSNALALDGTGDYVSLPNSRAFDIGAGEDFTIRARVNLAALSGFATILSLWNAPANRRSWALFAIDNGTTFIKVLRFSSSVDGTVEVAINSANDALTTGAALDIVVVRSSGVVTGYINGVSVLSATRNEAFYQNTADIIAIGAAGNAASFVNGTIDDVQFIRGVALPPS